MGCSIDEVAVQGDSATVWAEGECITYILANGELTHTTFSSKYFEYFNSKPWCKSDHRAAALEALLQNRADPPKTKIKSKRKKKRKEEIDPYQPFKNPYPINLASFPVGADGEYIGHNAAHIANYVSALFRNEKRNGATKPNFKEIADKAFGELGFIGKNMSAVRSALSKEIWRRRKAKAAEITRKKIEEARQAEFAHLLSPEID